MAFWRTGRQGENPALWRGHLDALLPAPAKVKKIRRHPALPCTQVAAFMVELKRVKGAGARALEFAIPRALAANLGLLSPLKKQE